MAEEKLVTGPRWAPDTKTDWQLSIGRKLTSTSTLTLFDSCEVRTESRFHFVVVTLCDSFEVRTESRFHFVV
jgi:hypothetical protein